MLYNLVLLIKRTIHMLSVYGFIFHLFQEILTRNNWLRLRLAEAEAG